MALEWFRKANKGRCYKEAAPKYEQALILEKMGNVRLAKSKYEEIIAQFNSGQYHILAKRNLKKLQNLSQDEISEFDLKRKLEQISRQ